MVNCSHPRTYDLLRRCGYSRKHAKKLLSEASQKDAFAWRVLLIHYRMRWDLKVAYQRQTQIRVLRIARWGMPLIQNAPSSIVLLASSVVVRLWRG